MKQDAKQKQRTENVRIYPGSASNGEIQIVAERIAWQDERARLCVARVRMPNGEESEQFRLGHGEGKSDGVVVVPIDDDDRIVMTLQFRHPVRMWLRELPRGGGSDGETPEETARKELHEEIGCELLESFPLGRIATDSGQLEGFPHILAARVRKAGDAEPESSEAIDAAPRYSYSELRALCERGEIVDSFTLAAVVRLAPHFDGDRFAYRPGVVVAPRG